ncbi:cis-prenyltransferase-like protein [Leptomonas pyrrhocoris]|uniref:Alkyl transferase n=1 Tax=Leptomonas pyrrhocoris TaxID=157538 RepID=A0A0N0VDU1_LEPPY|nr:cis-prenyltransferase-like protein [Leptomonas pyrrhocoris]KPA76578.1 cis-prenyltransferase-like protein [Leptomonas pyrrhocoris]|eukprot:XP_015655017.1 cis-prenyltransferase-like protein [Leptomonas pyrrhocoris]
MGAALQARHKAAATPGEYAAFNDSGEMLALRTACGTFGAACVSILFFAFFVQMGIVLLRLYTRKETGKASVPKPDPAKRTVRHLGIIMDGNRRFGQKHSTRHAEPDAAVLKTLCTELCSPEAALVYNGNKEQASWLATRYNRFMKLIEHTTFDGHRNGGEKLLEVLSHCIDANVDMVTAYAFSTDNWQRPAAEVDSLMSLFFFFFDRIRKVALDKHIFVRFISTELDRLPARVVELMQTVEVESRAIQPRRLTLNICVSYSGQSEVVAACNRILARRLCSCGPSLATPVTREEMNHEMLRSITQDDYEEQDKLVFTNGVSAEPELILRTSGEQRVSNFLLYECAYSEFAFFKKTWPEFTREDLLEALDGYASRDKRRGK